MPGSTLTLQFTQSFLVSQALELTVHSVLWFANALIPLVFVVVDRISQINMVMGTPPPKSSLTTKSMVDIYDRRHFSTRWRQFKSSLTTKFVYNNSEGEQKEDPSVKYGLDPNTWEEFVATRKAPNWEELQKYNDCPHILSRGGYDLLEKKLLDEKIKKSQHDAMITENPPLIDDPPSPIQRHVKWKLARTKAYGQMISKATKEISDKIDSLEEQMSQGSFVPHGHDDILNMAIGRPDHGGRVRAAGSGVTITQYYGRTSCDCNIYFVSINQQQMAEIIATIKEQVKNDIEEEEKQSLELKDAFIIEMSQKGSKVSAPNDADINVLGARVSTKESKAETGVNRTTEEHVRHVTLTMGLYVQRQHSTQLVALGNIFHGASTIHCVAYANDVVRVSVEKVIDGEAEVPFSTDEIKYVRQALHTFIAWPTPLVKLVSNEDASIRQHEVPGVAEGVNDVAINDPFAKFGIPHVDSFLFLTYVDVNEITTCDKCLNIAILQLWTMYMDEFNDSLGHRSLYGFLEPQSIHNAKDRRGQCEEYIEKWLKESQQQVYLGAYLNQAHWQLIVLCPKNNVVVWFCSLRKRPDVHIKIAINNAFKTLNTTTDNKTHVQRGGYECGYYVMHWMWNIVAAEMKNDRSWFGDGTPHDTDTITTLRQNWAAYFLKLRAIQRKKL
ncbi:hypothetical protein HKD37_04G011142 [Glycine soja]